MEIRPSLADSFVHSARMTEIWRSISDALELETIERLVAEAYEITEFMKLGARSVDRQVSCFCQSETSRYHGTSGPGPQADHGLYMFGFIAKLRILGIRGVGTVEALRVDGVLHSMNELVALGDYPVKPVPYVATRVDGRLTLLG